MSTACKSRAARERFEKAFAEFVKYDALRPMPVRVWLEVKAAKRALEHTK